MSRVTYKSLAREVVQELFKFQQEKIYEKFIEEYNQLIHSEEFSKEPKRTCINCGWYNGCQCGRSREPKSYEDTCEKYISNKNFYKRNN